MKAPEISWKVQAAAPSEALVAFQTAYQTAKAAYMAAVKGNERLACLQGHR